MEVRMALVTGLNTLSLVCPASSPLGLHNHCTSTGSQGTTKELNGHGQKGVEVNNTMTLLGEKDII